MSEETQESNYKTKTSTDGKGKPAKKIYRKPLERRLHLFEFVLNKKGGIKARAHWKQISAEWNKEHPYDRKDQAVLKVEYYRALKDCNVIINYVAIKMLTALKEGKEEIEGLDNFITAADWQAVKEKWVSLENKEG
jgi:hypothetical protein